jgi:hypothetical protein
MPRIKLEHEKSVLFVSGCQPPKFVGTGFIVKRGGRLYFITNHHVFIAGLRNNGVIKLRINTSNCKSRYITADQSNFVTMSEHDLAAIEITNSLLQTDEYAFIPDTVFLTQEFATQANIGLGEEVFLIGMFSPNPGEDQNLPSGRFGSISVMASRAAPIGHTAGDDKYTAIPSFIADMRSRPGYSGSPVFVYRTQWTDVRTIGDDGVQRTDAGSINKDSGVDTFVKLLGVHCAQYSETIELESLILGNLKTVIPSAMTIVIPAWYVVDLLNLIAL